MQASKNRRTRIHKTLHHHAVSYDILICTVGRLGNTYRCEKLCFVSLILMHLWEGNWVITWECLCFSMAECIGKNRDIVLNITSLHNLFWCMEGSWLYWHDQRHCAPEYCSIFLSCCWLVSCYLCLHGYCSSWSWMLFWHVSCLDWLEALVYCLLAWFAWGWLVPGLMQWFLVCLLGLHEADLFLDWGYGCLLAWFTWGWLVLGLRQCFLVCLLGLLEADLFLAWGNGSLSACLWLLSCLSKMHVADSVWLEALVSCMLAWSAWGCLCLAWGIGSLSACLDCMRLSLSGFWQRYWFLTWLFACMRLNLSVFLALV